jgi:hypothetical protein
MGIGLSLLEKSLITGIIGTMLLAFGAVTYGCAETVPGNIAMQIALWSFFGTAFCACALPLSDLWKTDKK